MERFKDFSKVEDIFEIRQGARTGLNAVFIVSKQFYFALSNNEKRFFRPAVANDSITNGKLNDIYYVFYPHSSYLPEKINQKNLEELVPIFFKTYLKPNEKKLLNRKGINQWWEMTRPRVWQKNFTPKIVSKEFGKAGDFAFDKDGIYIAERSHAWFPKNDNSLGDIGYAYIALLSMPIINDFLAGLSKQIAGGQWYLSSKFINKMPLPNLFDDSYPKELIDHLTDLGIAISSGRQIEREVLLELSEIIYNG